MPEPQVTSPQVTPRNESPTQDTVTPQNKTKKACDLCRNRKVKCRVLDQESDCQGCQELGLSCTRNKPRRRRGPLNRHALQQLRLSSSNDREHTIQSNVSQPTSRISPSSPRQTSASPQKITDRSKNTERSVNSTLELLAPLPLIHQILNNWFKFVHPLAPILHRQHLLHRIHDHGTESDPVFAALVISICSVTVSTLRRKSFEEYPGIAVDKCIRIIEDENLLKPQPYTLDWCITWYHVASALLVDNGPDDFRVYRAIKEAMTSVNYLLCFRSESQSSQEKEILKRLYWLLFTWQVGAELRGQPHLTFLPFNQDLDHLRPSPISDRELYPSLVPRSYTPHWPEDDMQFIPGLNSLMDVFMVWEEAKVDMACKPPEETLKRAMDRIQDTLDRLRPELRWRGGLTRFPRGAWGHEAQMVNILITALSIKSNFLQHLGSLLPGITHQDIVSDVLEVLGHLPQPVFEANGCSAVQKIRDIGAAYLAELRVSSTGVVGDSEAQQKVYQLLEKLESLDFRPSAQSSGCV